MTRTINFTCMAPYAPRPIQCCRQCADADSRCCWQGLTARWCCIHSMFIRAAVGLHVPCRKPCTPAFDVYQVQVHNSQLSCCIQAPEECSRGRVSADLYPFINKEANQAGSTVIVSHYNLRQCTTDDSGCRPCFPRPF